MVANEQRSLAAAIAPRRQLWTPEFEVIEQQLDGHEWPLLIVNKWEVNALGERRFVASASVMPANLAASASDATDRPTEEKPARRHDPSDHNCRGGVSGDRFA